MAKRILITGSNGLLGQKLVHRIINSDYELIATARGENRMLTTEGYTYASMDICSEEEVKSTLSKFKPDYVINTAAMTNVDQCETEREACDLLNVTAVDYLVEACNANNCHFVHVSTDFIFDGEAGPYDEAATPNPISYYGESKLKAEEIVKAKSNSWAILRTVLVFGITEGMSRSNIILWVKSSVEGKKAINVVNDQWRTPTLAEDLAEGCFLAATKEAKGIYNISGEELMNPYQMAMSVANYFQLDKSFITETDGSKFTQTAKRPPKTGFIITKAKKELGFAPHTFEEGIKIVDQQMNALQ